MQWQLYEKIVDEATAEPLLSGIMYELHNEPLLDKRLLNWMKHFRSINHDKWCALVTNGELLDRFNLKDIKEANVDLIMVSLNAHSKETYQVVNEGLDYDRVMQNISYLLLDSNVKKRLWLSFAITEKNMHEIYQATKYWHKKDVKTRVMGITNRAGTLEDYGKFKLKTGYRYHPLPYRPWRYFINSLGKITGCHIPFFQMNILFNGDIILCCHDWDRASVVGNVRNNSLREIWNSPKANEMRRLILKKEYEQIDACRKCSLVSEN
jgi:radical SAM protein with 4Fe4S-binding SPASM domain